MKYLLLRLVVLSALCLLLLGLSNPRAYACGICTNKVCNSECVASIDYCRNNPTGYYQASDLGVSCADKGYTTGNQCDALYCNYFCGIDC